MARGKSKRGCLKQLLRCRRGRELENDDDSIDENVHDARARRVRTNFYVFFFFFCSLSLSLIKERLGRQFGYFALTKFLPGHH